MITKNEAEHVPALLRSLEPLRPLGVELVVHDTGSTDATVRMLRRGGARVVEGRWTGDYGLARNEALAMARGEWVLSLDGDEFVVSGDVAALERDLRRRAARRPVEYVAQLHVAADQLEGPTMQWTAKRLLRRGEVTWYRSVHEFPAPLRRKDTVEGEPLDPALLRVVNVGFTEAERHLASMARKHELIEREVADGRAVTGTEKALRLFDLARSYAAHGQLDEAETAYRRALAVPDDREMRGTVLQYLADVLLEQGRAQEVEELLAELEGLPSHAEYARYQRGRQCVAAGRYALAADIFGQLGDVLDGQGLLVPRVALRRFRVRALAGARLLDDAAVQAVRLVAVDRDAETVPLLMAVWGARPLPLLARLLRAALPAGAEESELVEVLAREPSAVRLVEQLDGCGSGAAA